MESPSQLTNNSTITQIFRVISVEYAANSKQPQTRLGLQNRSHVNLIAIDWDHVHNLQEGNVVKITGRLGKYKGQPQIIISQIETVEQFNASDLLPTYLGDVKQLEARLEICLSLISNQHLQKLARELLDPATELGKNFRLAPASSIAAMHEPYLHGLMQHSIEVTMIANEICTRMYDLRAKEYGDINKSVVIFGALLHDLGKVIAYEYGDSGIRMAQAGKLNGHLIHSYALIFAALNNAKQINSQEITAILHVIASHHGIHGEQQPRTAEAMIVHAADSICSQLGKTIGNQCFSG